MKSTTIIIIRHGQTDWNVMGKIQGHIDIPLNDTGEQQAQRVASFLKERNITLSALYSSDLQRAHQTAKPISAAFSLDIITSPLLRERHVGIWQGKTRQQMREVHGEHFDFDFEEIIPGGESKAEFLRRMASQIMSIAQNHINESVIVVTHGHAIRAFLADRGYNMSEWPSIANTSLITVKYHHADEPQIELISIECAE